MKLQRKTNRKIIRLLTTIFLLGISAAETNAQEFKIGDTIYVNAFYAGCVRATVKGIDPKYSVHIEEGGYKDRDTFYSAGRIGECPQKAAEPKNEQTNDDQTRNPQPTKNQPANNGNPKVGDRVDVYLSGGVEGKNRGTIIEINGGQIKVRYDGCAEKDDVWENAALTRSAATISKDDPQIKFLFGKWSMTTVGISDAVIAWGKSPGIQINSDGTYVWYQQAGKPPVKGKWTTHAAIEGARFGTETENGILLTDANGYEWKMYRRKSTSDNADHITIRMMCQGTTQIGTRVR